ncbi:MAG TPA: (Fe-S)-binding protein [Polyangiaceae bacterium]|nr:(Fe-S)-binding protein [Polyangiaceae bacterium]
MAFVIVMLSAAFGLVAKERFELLMVGRGEVRWDRIPERIRSVVTYALAQKKMKNYPLAGAAHMVIFVGFSVLLLNTLILWGRGFFPSFSMFVFGHDQPLGQIYDLLKDVVAVLVIGGAVTFIYLRTVKREARMTLSGEALLILGIIITMMVADLLYNGAMYALSPKVAGLCAGMPKAELAMRAEDAYCGYGKDVVAPLAGHVGETYGFVWHSPASSILGMAIAGLPARTLVILANVGFWAHSSLVLIFLNILPISKHFHIITSFPNVFTRSLEAPGRLPLVAKSSEELGGMVEKAFENAPGAAPVGKAKIEDFSWKAILDFYTCTECGRCSDNCPAHKTGKMLSPKTLTLDLRDYLYDQGDVIGDELAAKKKGVVAPVEEGAEPPPPVSIDLVPNIVHPDVLWACTTCRACEEQCPVMISYVDKIVEMRRNLVLIKGEFPAQLNAPFGGMEVNGNPWNLARVDRAGWADGLDIPLMSDNPKAKVLYWVGCAGSYDDRAKKVARATAKLMKLAGVDFAILGQEETCTGDPARRAGNEYLFMMLAEQNVATLNGYKEQGGIKTIVTTCPHCFNTLANEYPDFGAKFDVVHHSEYLAKLVSEKKLAPTTSSRDKVAYHDSCYLGRYNDVFDAPRDVLAAAGVELVEVEHWNKYKGLCCGAGGAQLFMEEQNKDRVNVKRTEQLLATGAKTVATACPFCSTMLTDGLKAKSMDEEIRQLDIAEVLLDACDGEAPKPKSKSKSKKKAAAEDSPES